MLVAVIILKGGLRWLNEAKFIGLHDRTSFFKIAHRILNSA